MSSVRIGSFLVAWLLCGCPHTTEEQSAPPGLPAGGLEARWESLRAPFRPDDAAVLADGKELYQRPFRGVSCASCHGLEGDGRGVIGPYLEPRPPGFAEGLLPDAFARHPGRVLGWVTRGIARTPMPAFGLVMSEEERWKTIAYAGSLGRKAGEGSCEGRNCR